MTGFLTELRQTIRKLRGDRTGVGAVEFALVAPVLIVLYMGSLEVSIAMSVNKKLSRAASTVADLVTQDESINKPFLESMLNVAESVMTPFQSDGLKLKITGIEINGAGVGKVTWSWQEDGTKPYAINSTQTLPQDLAIPNTFLVRTEIAFDHDLMLFMSGLKGVDFRTIHMTKTYHLRQRIGDSVVCEKC
ncbi:TadE/TadG family type IV pilus assembly protein [Hoeflea ulvae]|uniref:Pilus assembly protein n=1 Tax=Hoeflea ulvae TaxID=2983764 RepID=A0ABT3YAP3_9HYPH|nr:TadE/TadG family type IV pilus assembly protein [Hoeflea ulvae]MCY0092950.1 pilus assembly protein [Hoeflea ulvae]